MGRQRRDLVSPEPPARAITWFQFPPSHSRSCRPQPRSHTSRVAHPRRLRRIRQERIFREGGIPPGPPATSSRAAQRAECPALEDVTLFAPHIFRRFRIKVNAGPFAIRLRRRRMALLMEDHGPSPRPILHSAVVKSPFLLAFFK